VLAEVDPQLDPSLTWTEQVKTLAHRLRTILETTPASPGCSKPATRSDHTPSPSPRHSSHHCTPPASRQRRPAWPTPCSTTTPSASPSPAPPASTNNGSGTSTRRQRSPVRSSRLSTRSVRATRGGSSWSGTPGAGSGPLSVSRTTCVRR
jgi:hypothetical protein